MSYGAPPPPNPYGGAGGYGQPAGPPPNNNLVWAILTTVLCCLPLGVASIVFAAQVNGKWASGDTSGAYNSAKKAKQFAIASAAVGAIGIVLYIIVVAVAAGNSLSVEPRPDLVVSRPPSRSTRPGRRSVLGLAATAATAAAATAAGAVLFAVDPNEPGHYPTCPFLALTGAWCPGCGSLRALHDLVHLDLAGAAARNPLALVGVVLLALAWVCWALRTAGRNAPHPVQVPASWIWAFLAAVVAFGVLRNVPGWTWLSPA